MDTNEMIRQAMEEYSQLHEEAKRVNANQTRYIQLFQWLQNTRDVFPKAFAGVESLPYPLQPPAIMAEIPVKTKPTPSVAEALGGLVGAAHAFQVELSIAAKRKANDAALARVERILEDAPGPLHLDEIIDIMKSDGWVGYPLDESINLYNALQGRHRRGDRFRNEGDNRWSLIKLSGGEP